MPKRALKHKSNFQFYTNCSIAINLALQLNLPEYNTQANKFQPWTGWSYKNYEYMLYLFKKVHAQSANL